MQALYAHFQRHHERMVLMDIRSAELTKYAANAMLATRISFMNELTNLAEKIGADIEAYARALAVTRALATTSCMRVPVMAARVFPKDVKALITPMHKERTQNSKVLAQWSPPTKRRSTCWAKK